MEKKQSSDFFQNPFKSTDSTFTRNTEMGFLMLYISVSNNIELLKTWSLLMFIDIIEN